jgi:hypothetical protein
VPYTSNFQTHYVALKDEKFVTILALLYACLELSHGVGVERKILILNVSELFLFPVTRVLKGYGSIHIQLPRERVSHPKRATRLKAC